MGSPGKRGPRGPKGLRGRTGKPGVATGGAVYTRWGRKTCPGTNKTTKLYSGVMAGSHYTHPGGGSNYLCLPLNPVFEKISGGSQGGYIYGTEYEIYSAQKQIFPNSNLHDHDAPCAVCHSESRASHVMIPARNVCPSGWTMEYKGYLMAEHHNNGKGRTQYICVDGKPEATIGSHVNKDGALLYFVESTCGSIPCPPYVQGYELTCVVCTK
ncbi:short-chain collagen C4-like [Dendronephthya gigantea]|uniref:short-chain collagen C4-like n=1 Tax=Dendronephthya gigantea TaxID=151771 RepID=UPI00106B7FBA|nr:short-chain collagen C4-like [Dendronephthya gigantea]